MKNAFQELIKSANKEDRQIAKQDLEESSNRRNRRFFKKKSLLGTPQTPVMMGK